MVDRPRCRVVASEKRLHPLAEVVIDLLGRGVPDAAHGGGERFDLADDLVAWRGRLPARVTFRRTRDQGIHERGPRSVVELLEGLLDKRAKLLRTHGVEGSLNIRLDP